MTTIGKLIQKLRTAPHNVREQECERLVRKEGFEERKTGPGSGRVFVRKEDGAVIAWHSPHGGKKTMRVEAIREILKTLGYDENE
jgi:hypothetical protein